MPAARMAISRACVPLTQGTPWAAWWRDAKVRANSRVPPLAQRARLDVADALPGHVQLFGQLFQAAHAPVPQSVPVLDHRPLLRLQDAQDAGEVFPVRRLEGVVLRILRVRVELEVAEG